MAQNIYDNKEFFNRYAALDRTVYGLNGAPEWPSLAKMLPKLNAINILDLGCGYGWFCRYAREKGATSVLGLDISTKMLDKARDMTKDNAITYRQENLETFKIENQEYDLVFSSVALHYIENLSSLIGQVYRGLNAGGHFVFSVEHPIRTAPKRAGWQIDKSGQRSWPVYSYSEEGKRVTDWLMDGVIKQHCLISTYLNLLIGKGFMIKYVEEYAPTAQQIKENPSLVEEKERPMFLLISAQKPFEKERVKTLRTVIGY